MTTEFFDIEMQRMIVNTANINERKPFSLTNHIFNFESMPSIQDCIKIIMDKSPIINNRSAKIRPDVAVDKHHGVIDILHTQQQQKRYADDHFDVDDVESQNICYENMSCRENIRRFLKEEEGEEKEDEKQ
jgi:hypothetical protein